MSNNSDQNFWRKCGSCKKEIPYNSLYQSCSTSGCQKFVYCSVDCWSLHNSIMNHKNGWCEEQISPKSDHLEGRRILVSPTPMLKQASLEAKPEKYAHEIEQEILIVASKLKQYVKDKHDLNTSADVMEALSSIVRKVTDQAVIRAKSENRKTLMKRDFF